MGANYTYYTRLDDDAEFNDHYWNRWTTLRRSIFAKSTLFNRIEGVYSQLTDNSTAGHRKHRQRSHHGHSGSCRAPLPEISDLGTNSFTGGQGAQVDHNTWRKEVDAMKTWIAERLEWMDGAPQRRAPRC